MVGGIGPRVGGAHVDVNMKMDDGSINTVGKQIHRQLSQLNKRLVSIGDSNRRVYQGIGQSAVTAWRAALGATVTAAPLIGAAFSGVAGAATMLGGALYSVGQSSGALLPVVTSLGVAGLTASIGMRNFGAAVSEVDPKKLQQLLADMPKSMQAAVMATRAMSKEMRAVIWEKLFVGVGPLMERLRETGVIQRGLGKMAVAINGVVKGVLRYVSSAQGVSVLNKFFANNAKVFTALGRAVVPFLDGFLRLVNALTPAALRFANSLTDVGKRFQSWTKGEGFAKRVDDSMKKAQKTASLLWKVLGNLGGAIRGIFDAANPATNTFLQMLVDVTQRFEDWSKSAEGESSIAKWAEGANDVMRQFGRTMSSVFEVIERLADPRVIVSFLKTVEGAFDLLAKLPLEKMVDAFVKVAEVLQPVSSLFLAIIIAGASLNIIIGSLLGQFGGFFSVLFKLLQFKMLAGILRNTSGGMKAVGDAAEKTGKKSGLLRRMWDFLVRTLDKVKNALIGVVGFFRKTNTAVEETATKAGRFSRAFGPVMSMLGRFAKFAGPVGIAVWLGSVIAKSDKLKAKFSELWDAVGEVGSALSGAFKEISEALKPMAPAAEAVGSGLGTVFGWLDKLAALGIEMFLNIAIQGFESLASVIEGLGSVVAGAITTLDGLFTMNPDKMLIGIRQMVSGVGPLLKGLWGLFATVFAPAKWAEQGFAAVRGLASSLGTGIGRLGGIAVRIATGVISSIGRLPGRLRDLGRRAVVGLATSVGTGIGRLRGIAIRIATGVITGIARLPGRLQGLGRDAVARLGAAVGTGIGRLRGIAVRIATGVVTAISRLPGRLRDLGREAISRLAGALTPGIARAGGIARSIGSAILGAIRGIPGQAFSIGAGIVGSLISGLLSRLGELGNAAGRLAGAIRDRLPGSPVKEGPLTAWNYGSGATGGGRNLVNQLAKGLSDVSPINSAMNDVANAIGASVQPSRGKGLPSGRGGGAGGSLQFPRHIVLRIGNREFETYIGELADDRIDAADNLAWQGA